LIFDDHFVDTNIYSGLAVTAGHRQSIHELVIGEQGVKLNREVQDLTASIADAQDQVKVSERDLPPNILGGMNVDDFCGLALPDDLQSKLQTARKSTAVLRDAENIRNTPDFGPLALPVLPTHAVIKLLNVMLPEIEAAAVEAVTVHLEKLNDRRTEHWISEGMEITKDASCPFCGQDLKKSSLIGHYRAYFSKTYRDHKAAISTLRESVRAEFDGDKLARSQRALQDVQARHSFWAKYVDLPAFNINVENVAAAWAAARDGLLEAVERKLAAPLEAISLSASEAIERYEAEAAQIKALSESLLSLKTEIAVAKEQAAHGSLATAEAQVAQLETIERRYKGDLPKKCAAYLAAKLVKLNLEVKKEEARTALNEHRKKVFVTYQTTINDFLIKFNADFRIEALKPSDAGGVTSSGYELVINKTKVGLAAPKSGAVPAPSFRTSLSAGDRNTLALAFFFTTLQMEGAALLSSTIIILDDPASSLDDGRAWSTCQEIQHLIGRAAQVIVLSHSRSLLCQLWEKADKKTTATLRIRDAGPEMSTLEPWDAGASAISEYDRLHKLVREFASSGVGQAQTVAPALRVLLESFLRVAFVEHFPPGKLLGEFL
jgi:wobble nucleotide-excising tRNase